MGRPKKNNPFRHRYIDLTERPAVVTFNGMTLNGKITRTEISIEEPHATYKKPKGAKTIPYICRP